MAVLSNRDLENATQQIVKENSFKKEVKQVIQKEIVQYGAELESKMCITVLTKSDALLDELTEEILQNLKRAGAKNVLYISSISKKGIPNLLRKASKIITNFKD